MISALLHPMERGWNAMGIAQEKIRSIHQRALLLLRGHGEAPQRGLRERFADGTAFVGIVAHRAVIEIFLDQQDLRAAALETHDTRRAKLAAVQSNVIRADARGKPALVKKFRAPLVDLKPQLALPGIPVQIEITGKLLRPRGFLGDGGGLGRFGPRGGSACRPTTQHSKEKPARNLRHVQSLQRNESFYNKWG